jgi:protein-S-isoprenylcysteine O-methyltransferase Ste14
MKRTLILLYGVVSYAFFLATFLYAIGFVGNIVVPKSIDAAPGVPLGQALLIDAALLAVFAFQHSIMARPAFKRWITQFIPKSAERSTFVLAASAALALLFAYWEPLGGMVWQVENDAAVFVLHAVCASGWILVLVSTFLIDHFDLFGLRQVWLQFRGVPYTHPHFVTPAPYRVVRHPLYVGFMLAFWATPVMTVSHLVFAVATTAYILVAIQLEERDLVAAHPEYADYRRRVPMLIPGTKRAARTDEATAKPVAS